jgi:hypothetical protein
MRGWVGGLLALAALVSAPSAGAKDGLLFDRPTASAGDTIVLSASWASHPTGVRVYLIPLAQSPRWWRTHSGWTPNYGDPPALKSAVYVGRTTSWREHGARLEFRVPRVVPGRYVLGSWCVPCDTHWTSALPNFQLSPHGILHVVR